MTAILAFLIETKLGRTIALSAAIFIGVSAGWAYFSIHYYNKGWNAAIHAVAAQNDKAINEANHAKKTVKDCFAAGGTWDVAGASCVRP